MFFAIACAYLEDIVVDRMEGLSYLMAVNATRCNVSFLGRRKNLNCNKLRFLVIGKVSTSTSMFIHKR